MSDQEQEGQRTETFINYYNDGEASELNIRLEKRFVPKTLAIGFGGLILGTMVGAFTSEVINGVTNSNLSHEGPDVIVGIVCGLYGVAKYIRHEQDIQEAVAQDPTEPIHNSGL